ncbi:MAG: FKBP-type peptidyl-prolyl cis-trans isomerase [Aeriscardovia sp.]|nr:FKBP-type peptidyl-prolyl cis-trans isomerase [Aeriscardovia sp.]
MKEGLPKVEAKFGGDASITFDGLKEQEKPELVCEELVKGDGPVVEKGDTITVHYSGVVWGKTDPFDSSFARKDPASFPIGEGMLIRAWDETLIGKTVGSRLLIVAPADYAYGKRGVPQAGIKGGDTLVFVVDILADRK